MLGMGWRYRGALVFVILAACSLLATAALAPAGLGAASKATATVKVSTRTLHGLGTVLVNSKGLTLYMFVPDKRSRVTCVSTCAAIWPPEFLPNHGKAVAEGKAKQKLLGSDRDPAGGRVVTYHGWPLYTYVADTKPGMATGQALNLNGGLWYVVAPSGAVILKKVRPM
jgi:predicted lipoprotein with Yx(FWY)xxD motif